MKALSEARIAARLARDSVPPKALLERQQNERAQAGQALAWVNANLREVLISGKGSEEIALSPFATRFGFPPSLASYIAEAIRVRLQRAIPVTVEVRRDIAPDNAQWVYLPFIILHLYV